jgi:hypothetical protein
MDLEAANKLRKETPPQPWPHEDGHAIRIYESAERLKDFNSPLEQFKAVGDRVRRLSRSDDRYRDEFPYPNYVNAFQVWNNYSKNDVRFFLEATYSFGADTSANAGELLAVESHWYHSDEDNWRQFEASGKTTQPIAVEYVDLSDVYSNKDEAMLKLAQVESSLAELEKQYTDEKSILFTRQEEFESFDTERPIEGVFTLTSVPGGDAPYKVRKQWAGVAVPIRDIHAAGLEGGSVEVATADIVVSLISQGKPRAAEWFMRYAKEANMPLFDLWSTWEFRANEGNVEPIEPISSIKFYNQKFDAQRKLASIE